MRSTSNPTYQRMNFPAALNATFIAPYEMNGDSTTDMLVLHKPAANITLSAIFNNRSLQASPRHLYNVIGWGNFTAAGSIDSRRGLDVVVAE